METKQRIEFIDLAKGVCISLVVLHHCHILIPGLQFIRMPLYYILSGIFFKQYDGLGDFALRKTNKILIPFLFFYIISFVGYSFILHYFPHIRINGLEDSLNFLDPWYSRLTVNYPLWFLLSLFSTSILFYWVQSITKRLDLQFLITILFAALGYYITHIQEATLPLFFDNTFRFSPFFALGYMLKRTPILYPTIYKKYNPPFVVCGFTLFFLLANISLSDSLEYIFSYGLSFIGVISLLFLCKNIKHLPFLSYFGRYSIIILCTHFPIMAFMRVILVRFMDLELIGSKILLFLLILFMEFFVIKFSLKYLGYFTAQKDLIPLSSKSEETTLV
jgi:fucose 4-O-acetylase-like acetyltransferase